MAEYVIDIPEEEVTNYRLWLENVDTEIGTSLDATPLEKVLEDIKVEIMCLPNYDMLIQRPNSEVYREVIEYHKVVRIIDKHMSGKE